MTDETMARRYLEAVGTPASRDILEFYGREWRLSERPTVLHPDREALWAGERGLQRLAIFERSADYDALLAVPLSLIRTNSEAASEARREGHEGVSQCRSRWAQYH